MNRLTKDLHTPHDDTTYAEVVKDAIDRENIVLTKLKHYEDIEEELGIDLITFSKILKQKFVFNKEKVKVDLLSLFLDIESNQLYMHGYIRNTFEDVLLYSKDYGKTWTITREVLEND